MTWLPLLVVGVVGVAVAAGAGYVRRRLLIVTVEGRSMEPTLRDGDRLLVRRRHLRHLRSGDVVVVAPPNVRSLVDDAWREPAGGRHVKRVAALPGQPMPAGVRPSSPLVPADTVVVLSDNLAAGVDSREWGPYPAHGVLGVVLRRMAR